MGSVGCASWNDEPVRENTFNVISKYPYTIKRIVRQTWIYNPSMPVADIPETIYIMALYKTAPTGNFVVILNGTVLGKFPDETRLHSYYSKGNKNYYIYRYQILSNGKYEFLFNAETKDKQELWIDTITIERYFKKYFITHINR
jgi:hypothetical protein